MKIDSVKITNFRGYSCETEISFDNLTVFVGKNDIGKSSVLEALDIFFNDGKRAVKFDKSDVSVKNQEDGSQEVSIAVIFTDLPEKIVIDATVETTLEESYLLNADNKLEVVKKYKGTAAPKVFIKAQHPTNPKCAKLLLKKNSDLKGLIEKYELNDTEGLDIRNNSSMRKILWENFSKKLELDEIDIDVSKEDAKAIWGKLSEYMPVYSLFQADRKNDDKDSEVQDPLKASVKEILNEQILKEELDKIAQRVRAKLDEVAKRTVEKLDEIDPKVAKSLKPVIPPTENLRWVDVFKNVSIAGDENISVNKRGSGTKRLILLSFFRAETERRLEESETNGVIYAIEEPETAQHTDNQRKLIQALKELSRMKDVQIVLTTHSPYIVKQLEYENLRLVQENPADASRKVIKVRRGQLAYPSLNEVNFIAFNEDTEEYHNELYGTLEERNWSQEYKNGKPLVAYNRVKRNGEIIEENITLTEYIRHQIHHPENKNNRRYNPEELHRSLLQMRYFIEQKRHEEEENE